jgi:integrase
MATFQKHISKTGKPTYRAMVRLKGHPVETGTFDRLTDAREWAAKVERAIKDGRMGVSRKRTFGELVAEYSKQTAPTLKDWSHRETHLAWWITELGEGTTLDRVTPERISAARDRLKAIPPKGKEKRADRTVQAYLASLSHAFTFGVESVHWLTDNPVARVKKPKVNNARVRYLSEDELSRLLTACKESRNADLLTAVILSVLTGGREEEVMALRWEQIDFQSRRITLRHGETKNTEGRILPLAGQAFELLKARYDSRPAGSEIIFPATRRAKKSDHIDLRSPFQTALKKACIENFKWHDLRHSFASYMVMSGVSLVEVAKIGGWKTIQMVMRYAHLAPGHVTEVGETLAEKMGLK